MPLKTFSPEVVVEYLGSEGVPEGSARELNRVARGHPWALSLGSALYFAGGKVRGSAATRHQVLEHMAALFLEDADSGTIQVVQAACLVRTATAPSSFLWEGGNTVESVGVRKTEEKPARWLPKPLILLRCAGRLKRGGSAD